MLTFLVGGPGCGGLLRARMEYKRNECSSAKQARTKILHFKQNIRSYNLLRSRNRQRMIVYGSTFGIVTDEVFQLRLLKRPFRKIGY